MCAAESQQSAFDFTSVDCDLCGSGEVSFLAAKFDGADAYSYMGFCYDSYVTPVVAAICRGFHGVIGGRGGLHLSVDFVGMAT